MKLFKFLGKVVTTVAKVAAPVVIAAVQPEAIINTAICGAGKHLLGKLPNNAIPYLNLGVSTAIRYAVNVQDLGWEASIMPALQEGGTMAALSTALHQALKLPTKGTVSVNGQSI